MMNFEKVVQDYVNFSNNYNKYLIYKEQSREYYELHTLEIDSNIDDYYENSNNKEKLDEVFEKHPTLRVYLSLERLKKHYKSMAKQYSVSSEFSVLGRCALCKKSNDVLVIYDLDENLNYCFETNDMRVFRYIETALRKTEKFITYIHYDETSVLKVIYQDVLKNAKNNLSNRTICCKVEDELNKARMFDQSYIVDGNDYLPVNIDDEYKKLITLYKENKIDKDEYYRRFYYFRIISGENIEKMYEESSDDQKEYIIQAYLDLSSNSYNNKQKVHIRTTSKTINKEVLNRREKPDTR